MAFTAGSNVPCAHVVLTTHIRSAFFASDETYGMPRIRAELQDAGIVASRKVVGWAFGEHMTADLVILALNMALMTCPRSRISGL